jgi:membrane fusion protein, multidrug efflux system
MLLSVVSVQPPQARRGCESAVARLPSLRIPACASQRLPDRLFILDRFAGHSLGRVPAKDVPGLSAADAGGSRVPVSRPVERTVTDYADFTGRTNAVESVDIRARVSGYLVQMPFKEGAEVKKGDLLFEVDPRPYEAQLVQAEGQVNLYKAQLALAKATYARDLEVAKTPGAVSKQQLDQDKAAVDEGDAAVKASQASMEVYKLNLGFTKVASPIDGQVSRYFLTLGNLVVQDQTLLTTVVSLDPI